MLMEPSEAQMRAAVCIDQHAFLLGGAFPVLMTLLAGIPAFEL